MFFTRFLRRVTKHRAAPASRRHRARPWLEALEDRLAPALLGLSQEGLKPDIASGALTNLSYTQVGNNQNPFHYDARALAITLGDNSRSTILNPTAGGVSTVTLDVRLDNSGKFANGVPGPDLTVTGKALGGDGTLLTAEVREFGFQDTINSTNADFEVRLTVTGGTLTTKPKNVLNVGDPMVALIHQPGLTITSFPKTFSVMNSRTGSADTLKLRQRVTDTEPMWEGCGCANPGVQGDPQDSGGGLVYLHDGESYQNVVDLTIPGRGFDWSLERVYRSAVQYDGPLGQNWDFNDNRHLLVVTARNLKEVQFSFPTAKAGDVVRDTGENRSDLYVRNPDGSYTDPPGFFTQLTLNPSGSYLERDADGTEYTYDKPDGTGLAPLTSQSDREGDTMGYTYNAIGRLSLVRDTLGRPITYTYDDRAQLTQVQDYTGRTVRYAYDAVGNLTGVTRPPVTGTPNGNDFPAGETTRYTYSSGLIPERLNHNLLTVIAPNQVADGTLTPRLIYTYDNNPSSPNADRVTSLVEGGANTSTVPAGGTITYQYQTLGTAPANDFATPVFQNTVTDRNGNQTQYQYNQLGNIVRQREYDNRNIRPTDPVFYETRYTYDGNYHLLQETKPQGNTISYSYDSSNPDRFQQGNLLSVTQTPDGARGGDQNAIITTYTYEPIYNQVRTMTEARGNDPSYVPQNGGAQSAPRYTTTYTYDYQEGTNFAGLAAAIGGGVTAAQVQARLAADGVPMGLGDANGDGRTDQLHGNRIRTEEPTVNLLAGSNEATVEGTTLQPIVSLYTYNDFGQVTSMVDPEKNTTQYTYYPERDPNGDGSIDNPSGNPTTGGYLRMTTQDAVSTPARDSGTNPPPTSIRHQYQYDEVGNITRDVDGRGIATDYVYNQLNQVVQTVRAAAHNIYAPDPPEPMTLTDFQYLTRTFYDFNGNVVLQQVEDRGNTSSVDGNPPAADLPATAPNPDPVGGTAYVDTVTKYDILDHPIETVREAANGANPEFLHTRYRYDPNGHLVLTLEPEGNATSSFYDERDFPFQSTRGATVPAPLTLLAPSDPTGYDVRGGLSATATYHYDLNGNLVERVDASDTDGSAANNSTRGGAGDRTRYQYDGFDRRTSVVDAVGNETVMQYDPAGNIIRTSHFGPTGGPSPTADGPDPLPGPVSSLGVIQSGNLVNSNLLSATEMRYDELSRTIQTDQVLFVNTIPTTRPADVADGATDLGKGNLTPGDSQAIPGVAGVTILGRVSDRTEYDRDSRVVFSVQDDGDTARTLYDGAGRGIRTVDPEGNTVEMAYDDDSNVIETRETDVSQVPGVVSEVFLTTNFYDSLNRLQESVDNLGQTRQDRYDSRDNLVATTDAEGPMNGTITRRAFPDGPRTVDAVNGYGNVTIYYYDGLGRMTLQQALLTQSGQGDGVSSGADLYGVKMSLPQPGPVLAGSDNFISTGSNYDKDSLLSSVVDDQGNVTVYLYDNLDRRVTETKGLTVTTTPLTSAALFGPRPVVTPTPATINNPASIPTGQLDAQLAEAKMRINADAPVFPALANRVDDHPPTTIITGYDPDGNVLIRSDENTNYTYVKYDAINRPIAVRIFRSGQADSFAGDPIFAPNPASLPTYPSNDDGTPDPATTGTTRQDFQYDGLSRRVRATDNNDPTDPTDDSLVTDAYDSLSRVIEETQRTGALPTQAIDSAWRAEDLRKSLTYPNGRVEVYTYDGLDRLKTVGDQGAVQSIAVYDYIGQDRVLDRSYPQNGTRETYLDDGGTMDVGYDGLRRPVEMRSLRSDNSLIVGFTYTYDRMNNKLTEGKLHDAADSETYTYDSAYRLTHFARGPGSIAPIQSNWTLDGVGNWMQVDSETRQHSSLNEITQRTTGSGTITVLSDDNGNEVDDGTYRYTYDAMNRLRTVTRDADAALIAVYSYDADGRRIRSAITSSGALNGTTDFYLDGQQEIEEHNVANGLTQQYVYGAALDEPLVLDRNLDADGSATGAGDQRLFYYQDTLYSVYALADTTGKIVEGYQYDAYGKQTVFDPGVSGQVTFTAADVITLGGPSQVANPYLFTGERFDAENGLYYYRARYLDPVEGRFLSRDLVGSVAANLYAYVSDNPINNFDSSGLQASRPTIIPLKDLQEQLRKAREKGTEGVCALLDEQLRLRHIESLSMKSFGARHNRDVSARLKELQDEMVALMSERRFFGCGQLSAQVFQVHPDPETCAAINRAQDPCEEVATRLKAALARGDTLAARSLWDTWNLLLCMPKVQAPQPPYTGPQIGPAPPSTPQDRRAAAWDDCHRRQCFFHFNQFSHSGVPFLGGTAGSAGGWLAGGMAAREYMDCMSDCMRKKGYG